MGVQTRALGGRSQARRVGLMLAIPALTLALALGGCGRAGGARNTGGSSAPVTQSATGTGSSSATSTSGSGGTSANAALQQLENADIQNQTDQQQLNSAGSNAGVDFSSQDTPIQP